MLIKETDYKVTYADNTNAGTAKVKITGINGYKVRIRATRNYKATEVVNRTVKIKIK